MIKRPNLNPSEQERRGPNGLRGETGGGWRKGGRKEENKGGHATPNLLPTRVPWRKGVKMDLLKGERDGSPKSQKCERKRT